MKRDFFYIAAVLLVLSLALNTTLNAAGEQFRQESVPAPAEWQLKPIFGHREAQVVTWLSEIFGRSPNIIRSALEKGYKNKLYEFCCDILYSNFLAPEAPFSKTLEGMRTFTEQLGKTNLKTNLQKLLPSPFGLDTQTSGKSFLNAIPAELTIAQWLWQTYGKLKPADIQDVPHEVKLLKPTERTQITEDLMRLASPLPDGFYASALEESLAHGRLHQSYYADQGRNLIIKLLAHVQLLRSA